MNRMMKAAAAAVAVGGLGALGCPGGGPTAQDRTNALYDPCWPERYNYEARQEVLAPFAAHAENGRIVDGTVYNFEFDPGTDKLAPGGMAKLDYLSRKRPAPDRIVYLQTARDLAYDANAPEKLGPARADLDAKRAAAIQKYLAATTAGRGLAFDVTVIDPNDITFSAKGPSNAAAALTGQYGASAGGAQGASGAAGGGGARGGQGGTGGQGAGGGTGGR